MLQYAARSRLYSARSVHTNSCHDIQDPEGSVPVNMLLFLILYDWVGLGIYII